MRQITYYSDKFSGQNRNQFVAGAYLYSMAKFTNLQEINHKFLESGHSHMECDSIHSTIETAKTKMSVFMPSQWNTVISMSRRRKPYHVVLLIWTSWTSNFHPEALSKSENYNMWYKGKLYESFLDSNSARRTTESLHQRNI